MRRNLLDCAAKLAADQGVAALSVQAVANAAGVTKGGLFHHFASKQVLLEAVMADLISALDAEIDALISQDCEAYGCFTRAYVNAVLPIAAGIRADNGPRCRFLWSVNRRFGACGPAGSRGA